MMKHMLWGGSIDPLGDGSGGLLVRGGMGRVCKDGEDISRSVERGPDSSCAGEKQQGQRGVVGKEAGR